MTAAGAAGRRDRLVVVSLALAGFIATLDDYIVSVSLPSIATDFNASTSDVALVTMVYLITLVALLLPFGRIGDRWGHRRVFLAGYAVFVASSALCALAPSLAALIGFRALQGAGAAMLSVSAPALIAEQVTRSMRGWAFGIFTTVTALGITLGAPLGGIISGLLSWHWIFAINVPIGLVAMVVAVRVLPTGSKPQRLCLEALDPLGVLLSAAGLTLLLVGLNRGEELGGWTSPGTLSLLLAGALALGVFVWWERVSRYPLLDLEALRDLRLSAGLVAALTGYMLLAGCNFVLPFYLTYVKGLRAEQVGAVMLVYSLVYVAASPFAGRFGDRRGHGLVSAGGMAVAAGGCVVLLVSVGWSGLLVPVVYLIWRALGYAFFIAPSNALVIDAAATQDRGSTSGMLKVAVNLSLVLGVVIFETLFSLPIAEGLGSLAQMSAKGQVDSATMIDGLRIAYGFGALVCLGTAAALLLAHRAGQQRGGG